MNEAEIRIDRDIIEIQRPIAVMKRTSDATEWDKTVETAAGRETAESHEILHIPITVDLPIQRDQTVEPRLLGRDTAIQSLPVEIDIIHAAIDIIVPARRHDAAVDSRLHVRERHRPVIVVDIPLHIIEIQRRHMKLRHGDRPLTDEMRQRPTSGSSHSHLVMDIIPQPHGRRDHPLRRDRDDRGEILFFEINLAVRLDAIPHHRPAEFPRLDVEITNAARVDMPIQRYARDKIVTLPIESRHSAIMHRDRDIQRLSLTIEIRDPILQLFLLIPRLFLLDLPLPAVDEIHIHLLIEIHRKGRALQRDLPNGRRDEAHPEHIPRIHLERSRRHTQDRIPRRIIPRQLLESDTAMDIRGDRLHRDRPPKHLLPRSRIVEKLCRSIAHDFRYQKQQTEKSEQHSEDHEKIP